MGVCVAVGVGVCVGVGVLVGVRVGMAVGGMYGVGVCVGGLYGFGVGVGVEGLFPLGVRRGENITSNTLIVIKPLPIRASVQCQRPTMKLLNHAAIFYYAGPIDLLPRQMPYDD